MRVQRLQEVYCRFEFKRTLRAAKGERHFLFCLLFTVIFAIHKIENLKE